MASRNVANRHTKRELCWSITLTMRCYCLTFLNKITAGRLCLECWRQLQLHRGTQSGGTKNLISRLFHLVDLKGSTNCMPPRRGQGEAFLGIHELCLPQNLFCFLRGCGLVRFPVNTPRQYLRKPHLRSHGISTSSTSKDQHNRR